MKIKSGQVYVRWILAGPITPFTVYEVGETSFTLFQLGIANEQTMDNDSLQMYLESGDCKLVYDPEDKALPTAEAVGHLVAKIDTQDAEIRRLRAVVACSGLDPDCPIPPSPLTKAGDRITNLRQALTDILDHDGGNRLNYKEISEIAEEALADTNEVTP
jgi:hypothetical protein